MGTSLTSLPAGTETPKDVITCRVLINDAVLNNEAELAQITVNKTFNKIAAAKLVFHDGSGSERDFVLSNDGKFKPGNKITIQMGYHGEAETIFKGIIIRHGIKIGHAGRSVLMIEAKDEAIRLTGARKSVPHIRKTDKAVITMLAGALAGTIDDMPFEHEQLVQYESTDWDFIVIRAEANGMLVLTDDGKLTVKKPSLSPATVTATFGENIYEFEADMDARRQSKKITGLSWDYKTQKTNEPKESQVLFRETGNIPAADIGKVIGAEVTLLHSGNLTQKQVEKWVDAYALRNQLSKAIGRVRIAGDAKLKPGMTIKLVGVGDHFNGNVFVSGVLHQYDGAWYTDIQFGWKEEWFYQKEKVMERPATGLLPGVNGLQIGKVQDIKDDGQYRIKVYVATTGEKSPAGIWARIATLDAGKDHGVVFRPQVDDEVVLGFLNDDPRDAIILGYLHSKDKQTSPLPPSEKKVEYGIVTKFKQRLVFDDTNKKITISTDDGKKMIVLNDSDSILMKDDKGNSFKMDSNGITIESKGTVTIKGETLVQIN
ncbi:MAG: type VI secretion system tip protein VgrG [Chitinophagaceae bacterium]